MAKNWFQNNWGNALGALIVATGAIASGLPARANDAVAGWQLAQVSSYGNSPTPLNLRPRVHIPLPSSRSSDYYPRYRRSQDHYDHYDDHHDHHRYDDYGYRRSRRDRDRVIIVKPGQLRDYGSIRVIRK